MGMTRRMRAKGFIQRLLVDALVHDEAHVPVGGGQEQQRVHEREVVADEERAAFGGDVVPAIHPDAIDRMGEHPQHETQQGVGQEPHDVNGRGQSHQRADEEDAARARVAGPMASDPIERPRPQTAPPRRARLAAARMAPFCSLAGRCWRMAETGTIKKPPKKPERAENGQELAKAQAGLPEPGCENREAQRAQRHQAILDFATGQVAGGKAPQPDAHRHGRPKPRGMHRVNLQNVLAVINHAICTSAARKKKYMLPRQASQSTRSPASLESAPAGRPGNWRGTAAPGPPPAHG